MAVAAAAAAESSRDGGQETAVAAVDMLVEVGLVDLFRLLQGIRVLAVRIGGLPNLPAVHAARAAGFDRRGIVSHKADAARARGSVRRRRCRSAGRVADHGCRGVG